MADLPVNQAMVAGEEKNPCFWGRIFRPGFEFHIVVIQNPINPLFALPKGPIRAWSGAQSFHGVKSAKIPRIRHGPKHAFSRLRHGLPKKVAKRSVLRARIRVAQNDGHNTPPVRENVQDLGKIPPPHFSAL